MRNIALRLTYDGSRYHGWQTQKEEITVQQAEEIRRLSERLRESAAGILGAGSNQTQM